MTHDIQLVGVGKVKNLECVKCGCVEDFEHTPCKMTRLEDNQNKVDNCSFDKVIQAVVNKGIFLNDNPIDFFVAMAEELRLILSKEELEDLHRHRDEMNKDMKNGLGYYGEE